MSERRVRGEREKKVEGGRGLGGRREEEERGGRERRVRGRREK